MLADNIAIVTHSFMNNNNNKKMTQTVTFLSVSKKVKKNRHVKVKCVTGF